MIMNAIWSEQETGSSKHETKEEEILAVDEKNY
jgi:hypothetical protein